VVALCLRLRLPLRDKPVEANRDPPGQESEVIHDHRSSRCRPVPAMAKARR